MTALTAIIAAIGVIAALGAWGLCHWLASAMDRDDRRDRGIK